MKYKIIVTGPVGAGKTTAINTLTDSLALSTDVHTSEQTTNQQKQTTTVAMDYGSVKLSNEVTALIYGTPGQERFEFMWEILIKGAHSLIILLDNSRNYPFRDLKHYIKSFSSFIEDNNLVIGVTCTDKKDDPTMQTYQQYLQNMNISAPVLFIDARDKNDMIKLLETSLHLQPQYNYSNIISTYNKNKETSLKLSTETIDSNDFLDQIQLTEKTIDKVKNMNGVTDVSLTNSIGELLQSTANDTQMNEFIAFLSGITPEFKNRTSFGEVNRIMLRGPKDENLTVFVEKERSLGIWSKKGISVPALSQQIEDMLQWM